MKVAVVQLGYGDEESWQERTERVCGLVAAHAEADLVVLPELWSAGGFDYRAWSDRAQRVDGPVITALRDVVENTGVLLHAGSIVEEPGDEPGPEGRGRWNTSVVLAPGRGVIATYRKIHRFGFGTGEPRLMEAGQDVVVLPMPLGDGGETVQVGLSTCYDLRFPELYRAQLDQGAEVFLIPAAWPAARVEAWRLLLRARAIENQAFVIAPNTAGTHAGTEMGGHSGVIDPTGRVLAEAGTDQEVLVVDLDLEAVSEARTSFPVLEDRRL